MISRRNFIKGFIIGSLFMPLLSFLLNRLDHGLAFSTSKGGNNSQPIPKGNKVIEIHNEEATFWDYKMERYLDYINQDVVDRMVDEGVCGLTGLESPKSAWKKIMATYVMGDKFAIKPNFNNINHGYKACFTSPQVISSVIKGLVVYLNVPKEDIYVYDLCKKIPRELVRDRIKYKVNYVERLDFNNLKDKFKTRLGLSLSCANKNEIIKMRNKIIDSKCKEIICYIPKLLTRVNHLINISLLTNHVFVLASGSLKNHFGTVRFSNLAQYPVCLHGSNIEEHIVDINLNPHIKDKTRLYICDGLFGVYVRGEKKKIHKWRTFPCKNGTPNSLFFSLDPLAMEKKIADAIIKERKFHRYKIFPDQYLSDYESQTSK